MEEEKKEPLTETFKQISLKEIEPSDAKDLFNAIDSQREYLSKWLPFVESTKTIEDSEEFIDSLDCPCSPNMGQVYAIRCDGELIGLVGTKNYDFMCNGIEIGYWLSEKFQGKGIASQSVTKLIDVIFKHSTPPINRIVIKCAVGNIPSSNIPKRLNFTLEGVQRDGEVFPDGSYKDIEVYSLLKREYVIE